MQRVPDPASYRREHQLGNDDPVPNVWFGSGPGREALKQELEEDQPCFVQTTAQYFLDQIGLEEYFERLIGHLQVGAARHTFDNARSTKLGDILAVDLIAGAVKSLMLNQSFAPLGEAEADQLRHLCLLTYRTADPTELSQGAIDNGTQLDSLPPRWLDLLAIIAYARRHHEALELLVTYPAPGRKSTFDLLDAWVIIGRCTWGGRWFEHSTLGGGMRLCEIRLWTTLLASEGGWIHFPMTKDEYGLYYGLHRLLAFDDEPQLREHPNVEKLCRVFSDIGIIPGHHTLSRFLSLKTCQQCLENSRAIKPCGLAQATMILDCFPISRVAAAESKNGSGRKLRPSASATLLLPITQWSKNNRDRLAVMRILLEQGCDPNDVISNNKWEMEYMSPARRKLADTPLHQAAERGDDQMVKLLLEFGAKRDAKSGSRGDTPAQRARAHQRFGTAAKIEHG